MKLNVRLGVLGVVLASALALAGTAVSAQGTGSWAGWYAGIQAGPGSGDADLTFAGNGWWSLGVPATGSFEPDGLVAGAHAGYGWQSAGNIYTGIDLSYSTSKMSETFASPAFPGIDTWGLEIQNILDLSGRIGYVHNNTLVYASAGFAMADIETSATPPDDISSASHNGFSLGIGVEFMLNNNMSLGLAVKRYDFGTETHVSNPACGPCSANDDRDVDARATVASLRVSFHF